MSISPVVRGHVMDGAKVMAAWVGWFWAINWNNVAAFLSCVLTMLFILDKMSWLTPLKSACSARVTRVRAKWFPPKR